MSLRWSARVRLRPRQGDDRHPSRPARGQSPRHEHCRRRPRRRRPGIAGRSPRRSPTRRRSRSPPCRRTAASCPLRDGATRSGGFADIDDGKPYANGLEPTDQRRLTNVCKFVYSSSPSTPPSTPTPDCLTPPNAASGVRCCVSLTQTVLLAIRSATANAASSSLPHTDAPSP